MAIERAHSEHWCSVPTRTLLVSELFEVNDWLRGMTTADYDITGCDDPNKLIVYFSDISDAVFFKLAWGLSE